MVDESLDPLVVAMAYAVLWERHEFNLGPWTTLETRRLLERCADAARRYFREVGEVDGG